ncbi:MAG: glycoside hydrolase, partial [Actinomycetota bacterium]|nr:glycoside hydrolase [Actinomycetota bacterium]
MFIFVLALVPALEVRAAFTPQTKFSAEQHDDWEPYIAADDSGHVYWTTTRYGGRKACKSCPDPAVVYRVSADAGGSWSKPRFICACPGVGGQHDPVMDVDDQGRVFFVWMNDFEVNFARSDDFGQSWTRSGAVDGARRYSDKPWIGVSDDGQDIYVTFNADGPAPGAPYTVYSHNSGVTWSPPILGKRNKLYWFAGGLTVTPNGTVFSAHDAYPQNYKGQIVLYLLRSSDGGRS